MMYDDGHHRASQHGGRPTRWPSGDAGRVILIIWLSLLATLVILAVIGTLAQ